MELCHYHMECSWSISRLHCRWIWSLRNTALYEYVYWYDCCDI